MLKKLRLIGQVVMAATVVAGGAAVALHATTAQAMAGYRVEWTGTDGLNVRGGPTTGHPIVGWMRNGTAVDLACYQRGTTIGGNPWWYRLNGPVSAGWVTATHITTPRDPVGGLPACDAAPAAPPAPTPPPPSSAAGTIGNRVADLAITYRGRWGGDACADAGMGSRGYVGGYSGGQCRQFVNCLVWRPSGHRINPSSPDYSFRDARRVTLAQARRGDLIQLGIGGHTAIVLEGRGGGRFSVVDSNYGYTERVNVHDWTPPASVSVWRYEQPAQG